MLQLDETTAVFNTDVRAVRFRILPDVRNGCDVVQAWCACGAVVTVRLNATSPSLPPIPGTRIAMPCDWIEHIRGERGKAAMLAFLEKHTACMFDPCPTETMNFDDAVRARARETWRAITLCGYFAEPEDPEVVADIVAIIERRILAALLHAGDGELRALGAKLHDHAALPVSQLFTDLSATDGDANRNPE